MPINNNNSNDNTNIIQYPITSKYGDGRSLAVLPDNRIFEEPVFFDEVAHTLSFVRSSTHSSRPKIEAHSIEKNHS